jgi:hypothetical protein
MPDDNPLEGFIERLAKQRRELEKVRQTETKSERSKRQSDTLRSIADKLSAPVPDHDPEHMRKFTFAYKGTIVLYVPDFRGKSMAEFFMTTFSGFGDIFDGKTPNPCAGFEKKMRQILDENPRADLRDFQEAIGIKVLKVSRKGGSDGVYLSDDQ